MIKKRSTRLALLACAGVASLGLLAGASPAAAKTKKKTVTKTATFSQCVNSASPISSDLTPATAVIPVSVPNFKGGLQDGVVTAITSAGVRITHTFDGDLVLGLVSPGGKVVTLSLRQGGSGDDYGSGAADCGGTLTQFSDSAATGISAGTAPFAGSFRPDVPLSGVVGAPARGSWLLFVSDQASGDEGTLHAFSLNFTYSYKAQVKKKKKKK
jgi:subtilisin-like proprotein convertase family protein